MLSLILLIFAFVLCLIQSLYPNWMQPAWGWLGLALYFLSLIIQHAALGAMH